MKKVYKEYKQNQIMHEKAVYELNIKVREHKVVVKRCYTEIKLKDSIIKNQQQEAAIALSKK